MSESKLRQAQAQALDAKAQRLQGERNFAEGDELLKVLAGYCHGHKLAMANMNVDEQAAYLLDVFRNAHVVYGVWNRPGGRGLDQIAVKGSVELLQDPKFGGGNTVLVDAVAVDDLTHAMIMKLAYTLQDRENEDEDTAEFAWDIVMPAMRAKRKKATAAFERDLAKG